MRVIASTVIQPRWLALNTGKMRFVFLYLFFLNIADAIFAKILRSDSRMQTFVCVFSQGSIQIRFELRILTFSVVFDFFVDLLPIHD